MKKYIVYSHVSPSYKIYIGITCQNPKKRWLNGNGYKNNKYFYKAIQKYGWENIEHKILFENLTKEEAEQKEIELIKYYKSNQRKFGYNIHSGGSSRIGNKPPSGINSPRHKVVEQYDLDGNYIREYGSLREISRLTNMNYKTIAHCCVGDCKSAHGYQWKYKNDKKEIFPIKLGHTHDPNVVLYHKVYNVETGEIFDSIKNAQIKYNTKNISRACRFNLTSGGYHWKYLENKEEV